MIHYLLRCYRFCGGCGGEGRSGVRGKRRSGDGGRGGGGGRGGRSGHGCAEVEVVLAELKCKADADLLIAMRPNPRFGLTKSTPRRWSWR